MDDSAIFRPIENISKANAIQCKENGKILRFMICHCLQFLLVFSQMIIKFYKKNEEYNKLGIFKRIWK